MLSGPMDIWIRLPDSVILLIFKYLKAEELLTAQCVSRSWCRVGRDELLWKAMFKRDWNINPKLGIAPGKTSWFHEYLRLWQHIPLYETEELKGHSHQVLHVSFSHNGKYFATCSKDGYVLLWDSGYPARIKHYYDMKLYSWKNTQYSEFNESDTLLLVSGVHFGSHSNTGGIAVFCITNNEFVLQCRMSNKPYDFFGTWYNDSYLLSGDLRWLAHLVSTSVVWLNRASQETQSEYTSIMNSMFKFYNRSASSIRSITVANCLPPYNSCLSPPPRPANVAHAVDQPDLRERGNPPSHPERSPSAEAQHRTDPPCNPSPDVPAGGSLWPALHSDSEFQCWRRNSSSRASAANSEAAEEERGEELKEDDDEEEIDQLEDDLEKASIDGSDVSSLEDSTCSSDESEEVIDSREKFLIFTMGSLTYTPHQIGLKRIMPFTFCRRIETGPNLKERVAIQRAAREAAEASLAAGVPIEEPTWHDYESVADRFDVIDHVIDLNGHIIGMSLSPDHRYLYVNVRPWPPGCRIENPLQPPPIAQEIDIHVIDLVTMKQVGSLLRAHRAYTPNDECFFIFLDVSSHYVASGAEDKHGYLWDRHYGICLAKFPHSDVVNSVAFNPRDPEMLVTASDDYTLKIWRSRSRCRRLNIETKALKCGLEHRRRGMRSS